MFILITVQNLGFTPFINLLAANWKKPAYLSWNFNNFIGILKFHSDVRGMVNYSI